MIQLFQSLINGSCDFNGLKDYLWTLYLNYDIPGKLTSTIVSFGMPGYIAMIAVGLIYLLYGKKFFTLGKFVLCAGGGFFLGAYIISPIVNTMFPLNYLICGAIFALLCGVLCKFVYNVMLYASVAILTYVVLFSNGVVPFVIPTQGNMIFSLVGVAFVILIMVLLRKNIDRIVTSVVGATLITFGVKFIYDFTVFVPGYETLMKGSIIAFLAILGFAFQYVRRKRY